MEIASGGATFPQGPHQGSLRVSGPNGMAEVDDREVTFHGGRLGPGKHAQWSAGPPSADVDVSHLISMLTARLRMGTPRLNTFSGDVTPGKTNVSFEQ